MSADGGNRVRTAPGGDGSGDLVAALVELRNAITPLVEDLLCEIPPSVERWLAFAEAMSSLIPLYRLQVQSTGAVQRTHGRTSDS